MAVWGVPTAREDLRGRADQLADQLVHLADLAETGSSQLRAVHAVVAGLAAAAAGDLDRAFQQWSGTVLLVAPRAGWYADPVRHAWPLRWTPRCAPAAGPRRRSCWHSSPADRAGAAVPARAAAPVPRAARGHRGGRRPWWARCGRARPPRGGPAARVLGYPYWRALAEADLAAWLRAAGRTAEAAAVAQRAAMTFRELGARPPSTVTPGQVVTGPGRR